MVKTTIPITKGNFEFISNEKDIARREGIKQEKKRCYKEELDFFNKWFKNSDFCRKGMNEAIENRINKLSAVLKDKQ